MKSREKGFLVSYLQVNMLCSTLLPPCHQCQYLKNIYWHKYPKMKVCFSPFFDLIIIKLIRNNLYKAWQKTYDTHILTIKVDLSNTNRCIEYDMDVYYFYRTNCTAASLSKPFGWAEWATVLVKSSIHWKCVP